MKERDPNDYEKITLIISIMFKYNASYLMSLIILKQI